MVKRSIDRQIKLLIASISGLFAMWIIPIKIGSINIFGNSHLNLIYTVIREFLFYLILINIFILFCYIFGEAFFRSHIFAKKAFKFGIRLESLIILCIIIAVPHGYLYASLKGYLSNFISWTISIGLYMVVLSIWLKVIHKKSGVNLMDTSWD